jgi:hypothetical protein
MEHEDLATLLQEPATCLYPEPDKSSPRLPTPNPAKSLVHFLLLTTFQRNFQSPKFFTPLRKLMRFYGEDFLIPNPKPNCTITLVGCPVVVI